MAGIIRREDVEQVRERARLDEIIAEQVALRPAGVGSLKGLCPFHDEKTPSFHVRPAVGHWHCFGCGESGDVFEYVMKVHALAFGEAVEYLAQRTGVQLRYEEGSAPKTGQNLGTRSRLLAANTAAQKFFAEQLFTEQAAAAREFLQDRGFFKTTAEQFGLGYAPQSWDALIRHLRAANFTDNEILAAGLASQGNRGIYDRFRGRLLWPIRDTTGEVIGFGARQLFDDDSGAKYLNTAETQLYRKSHVLYGLDLAKTDIARQRRVVVVEGYTDVMAMHLAGETTAVATCGTAFGTDHAKLIRRLMGDTLSAAGLQLSSGISTGGEIIFTFDGDEAGRKAAMRAFNEDQTFLAQTFVAISPDGYDPCELRKEKGDDALRKLVASRIPLFEFVLRSILDSFDLNTAEGRVAALRAAAPVIKGIRDTALQPEYGRWLAGRLGMPIEEVSRAVRSAARLRPGGGRQDAYQGPDGSQGDQFPQETVSVLPKSKDPTIRTEQAALEAVLQHPELSPDEFDLLGGDSFTVPAFRSVYEAISAAGGVKQVAAGTVKPVTWLAAVRDEAPRMLLPVVDELAAVQLPEDREQHLPAYVQSVVVRLVEFGLTRRRAELRSQLDRIEPDDPRIAELGRAMQDLEAKRRALRGMF